MMLINYRQCRQARLLLKWNYRDLSRRANVSTYRLEQFEKGTLKLYRAEIATLISTLKRGGIVFSEKMDPSLPALEDTMLQPDEPVKLYSRNTINRVYDLTEDYLSYTKEQNSSPTISSPPLSPNNPTDQAFSPA